MPWQDLPPKLPPHAKGYPLIRNPFTTPDLSAHRCSPFFVEFPRGAGQGYPPADTGRKNAGDMPARSCTRDNAARVTPRCRAAAVTVSTRAGNASSRKVAPAGARIQTRLPPRDARRCKQKSLASSAPSGKSVRLRWFHRATADIPRQNPRQKKTRHKSGFPVCAIRCRPRRASGRTAQVHRKNPGPCPAMSGEESPPPL